jgi:hypothetical protein
MKAMYYVDASTLSKITSEEINIYNGNFQPTGATDSSDPNYWNSLDDPDTGCKLLEKYSGSISVTDLLKRDLGENPPTQTVSLNDKYGNAKVPGKTAMRCAMKELMKPFAYAGYRYYVEARDPQGTVCTPMGGTAECSIPVEGAQITNSRNVTDVLASGGGCDAASKTSSQLLSVSSPFRVLKTHEEPSTNTFVSEIADYKIRICVWPGQDANA